MEEKQEKKQEPEFKGKMGILWLVGILVIVLGCLTVYTIKLANDNKKQNQAPAQVQQTQTATVQEQPKLQSEIKTEEKNKSEEKSTKTTVMTVEEKYNIWVKKVQEERSKAKNNAFFQNVKITNNKTCEVALTSKGLLYFTLENQGSREFDKDVINFEICDVGNSGNKAVYYIKKDGTVYYVVLDEYTKNDGDISPVKIKNAKNIVSIINNTYTDDPSWTAEVWLIDIDGNVYK